MCGEKKIKLFWGRQIDINVTKFACFFDRHDIRRRTTRHPIRFDAQGHATT
jgi:hypothetical protein